ncbi:PIR protein [Plasmodium vivax]|uniref:VIR protein n=1 Tax=Plasmodium vivax TaxID=5855 RepID=A0A565A3W3_PLAVI|nr:PIR protein [Plasmodium vivax]
MSKACKENFNEYPSYDCYKELIYQFDEKLKGDYTIIKKVLDFEKDHASDIVQKIKGLSDVFINLKKYLSNGHVFASGEYDGLGTCKYMSYLLYDGIRNKYGRCDKETFDIFKDFVNRYNNITHSNMCNNKLNLLEDHEFNKMKNLTLLYDKYIFLLPRVDHYKYVEGYCDHVLFLVKLYNYLLNNYEFYNKEFNNILIKFRKLMNNITDRSETYCQVRYSIGNPRLYEPPVERTQDPDTTALGLESGLSQQGILNSTPHPKPEEEKSSSTMLGGSQEITGTGNLQSSQVSDQLEAPESSVLQEPVERSSPYQKLEDSEPHVYFGPQETYVLREPRGSGSFYERRGHTDTNETFLPGKDSIPVTKQLEFGSEKENAGVMTKIQDAFSGFINEVEPGPVLGVSGGMGALFLLFKYTPVGSFFGGRRGRIRQIPSSFRGFPPGDFANFQEYDGGLIGYSPMSISSLAE